MFGCCFGYEQNIINVAKIWLRNLFKSSLFSGFIVVVRCQGNNEAEVDLKQAWMVFAPLEFKVLGGVKKIFFEINFYFLFFNFIFIF